MTLLEAFKVADSVLSHAVGGIAEIITTPGLINVDFADVKTIMKNAGTALLGIGTGVGENRAQMAARAAIASPLLDLTIEGATGVLFNVTGGQDLTMFEVDEAARIISSAADADANIIFGAVIKNEMTDQLRITVVATGFDETRARIAQFTQRPQILNQQDSEAEISSPNHKSREATSEDIQTYHKDKTGQPDDGLSDIDEFGEKFEIPAFLRKIQ
jgi:cell division protein FtsZ